MKRKDDAIIFENDNCKKEKKVFKKLNFRKIGFKDFTFKDLKTLVVAGAVIVISIGGFNVYGAIKDRKEKKVIARYEQNDKISHNNFDSDVLYALKQEENISRFEQFVENSMSFSPIRVVSEYKLEYSENTDKWYSFASARYKDFDLEFITTFLYPVDSIVKVRKDNIIYFYLDKENMEVITGLSKEVDKKSLDENGKEQGGIFTSNDKLDAHDVAVQKTKTKYLIHNTIVDTYLDDAMDEIKKYIEQKAQEYEVQVKIITDGVKEMLYLTGQDETDITEDMKNFDDSNVSSRIIKEDK